MPAINANLSSISAYDSQTGLPTYTTTTPTNFLIGQGDTNDALSLKSWDYSANDVAGNPILNNSVANIPAGRIVVGNDGDEYIYLPLTPTLIGSTGLAVGAQFNIVANPTNIGTPLTLQAVVSGGEVSLNVAIPGTSALTNGGYVFAWFKRLVINPT